MTKQETFNLIVAHLRTQGKRAGEEVNGRFRCRYRAADGCKCAAGCLIPDDEYSPDMEQKAVSHIVVKEVIVRHGHDPHLVEQMQEVHDDNDVGCWEEAFRHVAWRFDLVYTPPARS